MHPARSDPSNYGDLLIKRIVGVAGDWVTFPDRSHPDVFIRNGTLFAALFDARRARRRL